MGKLLVVSLLMALVALTSAPGTPAQAATYTWTGNGTDDLWTNPDNWSGSAPVSGDTGEFNNTVAGGTVDTGSASDTWGIQLVNGANGYTITGTGTLSRDFLFNTSGTNTLDVNVSVQNCTIRGTGTLNVTKLLDAGDSIYMRDNGTALNIKNGGAVEYNRLHMISDATTINVEAGGLLTTNYFLQLEANSAANNVNVWGTLAPNQLVNNGNGKISFESSGADKVTIYAGGLVMGGIQSNTNDAYVDMAGNNATLALKGGSADVDTLAEFYALTSGSVGLNGDNFLYDGTAFDFMTGSDWYTLAYVPDYQGTGQGYTVLTVGPNPIPEPGTLTLIGMALLGLGWYAWRKRR